MVEHCLFFPCVLAVFCVSEHRADVCLTPVVMECPALRALPCKSTDDVRESADVQDFPRMHEPNVLSGQG